MSKAGTRPDFRKLLASLGHQRGTREVFEAFVQLAACALSMGTREAEYMEAIKRWKREDLEVFSHALGALVLELEAGDPFTDVLGPYHMETLGKTAQNWNSEFHTPAPVARLMAAVTLAHRADDTDPITLMEPACGSGVMLLAVAAAIPRAQVRRLRVTAVDISRVACDMCYINTTLWGIACTVVHGNTLSGESWGQWSNPHRMMPSLWRLAPVHRDAEEAKTPSVPDAETQAEALAATGTAQGMPATPETMQELKRAAEQLSLFPEAPTGDTSTAEEAAAYAPAVSGF